MAGKKAGGSRLCLELPSHGGTRSLVPAVPIPTSTVMEGSPLREASPSLPRHAGAQGPRASAVSWRAPERRSWGCVHGALTPHLRVAGTVTVCSQ